MVFSNKVSNNMTGIAVVYTIESDVLDNAPVRQRNMSMQKSGRNCFGDVVAITITGITFTLVMAIKCSRRYAHMISHGERGEKQQD
jgi:hypothetical protein